MIPCDLNYVIRLFKAFVCGGHKFYGNKQCYRNKNRAADTKYGYGCVLV